MVELLQMGEFVADDVICQVARQKHDLPAEADVFAAVAAAPAGGGACDADGGGQKPMKTLMKQSVKKMLQKQKNTPLLQAIRFHFPTFRLPSISVSAQHTQRSDRPPFAKLRHGRAHEKKHILPPPRQKKEDKKNF